MGTQPYFTGLSSRCSRWVLLPILENPFQHQPDLGRRGSKNFLFQRLTLQTTSVVLSHWSPLACTGVPFEASISQQPLAVLPHSTFPWGSELLASCYRYKLWKLGYRRLDLWPSDQEAGVRLVAKVQFCAQRCVGQFRRDRGRHNLLHDLLYWSKQRFLVVGYDCLSGKFCREARMFALVGRD